MVLFVVLPLRLTNPQQSNLEGLLVAWIDNDQSMDMQLMDCEGNLQ
jgi:hypothetical protein